MEVEMYRNAGRSPAVLITALAVMLGAVLAIGALPSAAGASSSLASPPSGLGRTQAAHSVHARPIGAEMPLPSATSDGSAGGRSHAQGIQPLDQNYLARITQTAGFAGYDGYVGDTTTAQVTVTLPTIQCSYGSNSSFPGVSWSYAVPGVEVGPAEAQLFVNCRGGGGTGAYYGWSTLDPACFSDGCPNEQFVGGTVSPGDQVEITAGSSPTGSSVSFVDESSGASLSYSNSTATTSETIAGFSVADYCFGSNGDGEGCGGVDPTSSVLPPGFGSYSSFAFSDATINGAALGSTTWTEFNSVWGSTLDDQTADVGSGSSYTVSNSDLALPSVSLNSPSVDRPAKGSATLNFIATLTSSSSYPIYLDYATEDGTASAGQEYQAVNGTLYFPPGTSTQSISVPVTAGSAPTNSSSQVYFTLQLANPSYVAAGTSSDGTIYEGPVVFSVTQLQVPLNGGGVAMTISGADFGEAGTRDQVSVCDSASVGTNCVAAASPDVQSDNTITYVAPDGSSLQPGTGGLFFVDNIVTNPAGVSSPISYQDEVQYGCQTSNVDAGGYVVGGCLTVEPWSGQDVTEQDSNIDGVNVTASAQDQVDYGSGTATSTGPVTMSLNMAGQNVNLFKGVLNQDMTAPMAYHPQGSVGGFKFAGQMTLTGTAGSDQSSGQVAVTAPVWLGGGQGTMTFTTATNGGTVQNLQVTMGSGSFGDLLSLTSPTAVYSGGTWQLSGQASAGGGSSATTTTLDGSFTYSGTTLTGGSLTLAGAIPLFGTVLMGGFDLNYTEGSGWSGTAQAGAAPSLAGLTLSFSASPTGLITKGTITLSSGLLLGELQVATATLTTDNAGWSLAVVLPGGSSPKSSIKGNLTVTAGVVTAGSITAKKVSIGLGFSISGSLTYALNGGNQIWDATVGLGMPAAPEGGLAGSVTGVQIGVTYVNGVPSGTQITFTGSVPLQDGLFLTQLGAGVQWNPTLVLSNATVGIGFGPEIDGVRIASITGTYTAAIPPIAPVAYQSFVGTLTVGTYQIGQATATAYEDGTTNLSLELGQGGTTGFQVGKLSVVANLTGSITSAGMTLTGNASVTFAGQQFFAGTLNANLKGMAACNASDQGFVWNYGQSGTSPYWVPQGCAAKLASF
jgi:hypothetical protein